MDKENSSSQKNDKDASNQKRVNANQIESQRLQWLAYCYFHDGKYYESLELYNLLYETESDPTYHLYRACCLYHLQNYDKALEICQLGPPTRLQNRLLLHIYHKKKNEIEMLKYYEKISDTTPDQLSLAAIHYSRSHFQDATDIYKKEWMAHRNDLAIQIYVAFCFYQLDRHDTSNDIIEPYLNEYPDSIIANNLKACNIFRLYDGKQAINFLRKKTNIIEIMNCTTAYNQYFNLIKHNMCVFKNGQNALDILPPLIQQNDESMFDMQSPSANEKISNIIKTSHVLNIPEARLNLAIYHLKNDEFVEAYQLIKDLKPSSAIEYILKAVVAASIGQLKMKTVNQYKGNRNANSNSNRNSIGYSKSNLSSPSPGLSGISADGNIEDFEKEINFAIKCFNLVGSSQSECDTIPGRQCMASYHFLNKEFEDVLIYLESIKDFMRDSDIFNYNFGITLVQCGKYKQGEQVLLSISDENMSIDLKYDFAYLSHLCTAYIHNDKAWEAWNLYLQTETTKDSFYLLQLIANQCYKIGSFYYSAKAFDALLLIDKNNATNNSSSSNSQEYWFGKRGACCGVFQMVVAGNEMKENLFDIMQMLHNDISSNPQSNFILRAMKQWCNQNNIVPQY